MSRRSAVLVSALALLCASSLSSAQTASMMRLPSSAQTASTMVLPGDTDPYYCSGGGPCQDASGCQGTMYCATTKSTPTCRTPATTACDGFGVKPGSQRACGATAGVCQPPYAESTEICTSVSDDNRMDGVNEASVCSGFGTFDVCENGVRWRCSCDERQVGYALGAGETSSSCSTAQGCLRKPPDASAGGYFQCALVESTQGNGCSSTSTYYADGAFQCSTNVGQQFECVPSPDGMRQPQSTANGCVTQCADTTPTFNRVTGARTGGGSSAIAYERDTCTQAQAGYTVTRTASAGPTAMQERAEDGVECHPVPSWAPEFSGDPYTCRPITPPIAPGESRNVGGNPGAGNGAGQGNAGGGGGGGKKGGGGRTPDEPPMGDCATGASQAGTGTTGVSASSMAVSGYVDALTLATRHSEVDLSFDTTYGGFNFVRQFTSSDKLWAYHELAGAPGEPYLPKPFGASPTGKPSLLWWHNAYSFVFARAWFPGVSTWVVRDTNGDAFAFTACSDGRTSCWAKPHPGNLYSEVALYWEGTSTSTGKFIFYRGQNRTDFGALWSSPQDPQAQRSGRYFITRIYDRLRNTDGSARVRLTFNYAQPSGIASCVGNSASGSNAPFLSSITTENGQVVKLKYAQLPSSATDGITPATECVLRELVLVNRGLPGVTNDMTVATYQYQLNAYGAEAAGHLAGADILAGRNVTYSGSFWATGSFSVTANGTQLYAHSYGTSGTVTSSSTGTGTSAASYSMGCEGTASTMSTGSTTASSSCTPAWPPNVTTTVEQWRGEGDGTGKTGLMQQILSLGYASQQTPWGTVVTSSTMTCLSGVSSTGCRGNPTASYTSKWLQPSGGALFQSGASDAVGRLTEVTSVTLAPDTTNGEPAVTAHANVPNPHRYRTTKFSDQELFEVFEYASTLPSGAAVKPVVREEVKRASILAPSEKTGDEAKVIARTYYDEKTNQLLKTVVKGWTKEFDKASGTWPSTPMQRYIATFYFTYQKCSGQTKAAGEADNLEVKEVHGPCNVTSFDATDCSGIDFPITQYTYYLTSETYNVAGRLEWVKRVSGHQGPTSCAGVTSLVTKYENYDPRGNVLYVTDPNQVSTTFTYDGAGRVTSSTTEGRTTNYVYDGAYLQAVQYPMGNWRVMCHRQGSSGSTLDTCTGGVRRPEVQWVADAASQSGSGWQERAEYAYYPDGTLQTVSFRDATSGVRRQVRFAHDAQGRTTRTSNGSRQNGGVAVSVHGTTAFAADGQVTALGAAFNEPPAFCNDAVTGALSHLCTQLGYDAKGRLTSVDGYPKPEDATAAPDRTVFGYDAHNNIVSVKPACEAGTDASTCTKRGHTYVYDDFGRLIQVQTAAATGPSRYSYTALGALAVKQTEAMANYKSQGQALPEYLGYQYDALGRLTRAERVVVGGTALALYELRYGDNLESEYRPPDGCEFPLNSSGRLAFRLDSFGRTWNVYDKYGALVREERIRDGATLSCALGAKDNPDTRYTYNANGLLTSITYPFGRTVTYTYGTGGTANRVQSVSTTTYDGTQWVSRPLLSDVRWEPMGGLASYAIAGASASQPAVAAVAYYLGGTSSQPDPSGGWCGGWSDALSGTNDQSGLLRVLRVSTGSTPLMDPFTFTRIYTWQADQVVRTDTCLKGETRARTELFGYDASLRLTSVGRPATDGFETRGGVLTSRTYGYDGRGKRTAQKEDAYTWTPKYNEADGAGALPDRLTSLTSSAETTPTKGLAFTWTYDEDGRVTGRTNPGGTGLAFKYGSTRAPETDAGEAKYLSPATDSVFRAVQTTVGSSSVWHNYLYDAFGRRRYKAYPGGGHSEFFFAGSQLLSERSTDTNLTPINYHVQDDYVWLGGRPVAIIHGRLDANYTRQSDTTADTCARNGEGSGCGFYFPVTDHIGKPVLMLDAAGKVAGEGEYDPYGHVNRVAAHAGTAHPYLSSQTNAPLFATPLTQVNGSPNMVMQVRADFASFATEANKDLVYLRAADGSVLAGPFSGMKGRFVTGWVTPSGGKFNVTLSSDASNTAHGLSLESYHVRRYESGAKPFWTNLRFPGQYYDEETDLFENWNRYYDPRTGSYSQVEPLLAQGAHGNTPAYAYAKSNPMWLVDLDGFSSLVYNNSSGMIALYDRYGGLVGSWMAANRTTTGSNGPWPAGTFSFAYYKPHPEDNGPNGAYGQFGIFIFDVPGRSGMGVHAGRANYGELRPTYGCVRTTDAATSTIYDVHFGYCSGSACFAPDPLTQITVVADWTNTPGMATSQ